MCDHKSKIWLTLSVVGSVALVGCNTQGKYLGMEDNENENIEAAASDEITSQALPAALAQVVNNENTDHDEDSLDHIIRMRKAMLGKDLKIVHKQHVIDNDQAQQGSLESCNESLQQQEQNKKQDTQDTLGRINGTSNEITIKCKQCNKTVCCTSSMLQELLNKYKSVYNYNSYETYRWFMWWKWGHRTHVYNRTFNKCFQCLNKEDVEDIERTMHENEGKITDLGEKIANNEVLVRRLKREKRNETLNLQAYVNEVERRQQERAEKERERAEKERERAEKERERAEKEQAQARERQTQEENERLRMALAVATQRAQRQDPIGELAGTVGFLTVEGAEFEFSMDTRGLTQEGRAAMEERLQVPVNDTGVHRFILTANRGREDHQITNEAQPTVVVVNQSGHEQPRRRDDQEIRQNNEEELRLEERRNFSRNLLTSNLSIEFIAGATGLSREEVEAIQRDMAVPVEEVETVQEARTVRQEVATVPSVPSVEPEDVVAAENVAFGSDFVTVVRGGEENQNSVTSSITIVPSVHTHDNE